MELIIKKAVAYIYNGEWVADCPAGCNNVEFLFMPSRPGGPKIVMKPMFQCSYCGEEAVIAWPDQMHELMAVLVKRPMPSTRNWYPKDHDVAVRFKVPHGQTVEDLREENVTHGVAP